MGAGKSSIGKKLSKRLGLPFVDSDRVIVRRHGVIAEIFATHGEQHFRGLERDVVAESLAAGGVLSLGGGAVLHPDTRDRLTGHRVVLLTVSADAVASRITGGGRPLLGDGGLDAWRRIALERDPIYRSVASVTFDTSHRPISTVVDDIVSWVEKGAS
ncbi:shikimate kinase [Frigoribacterium sp. 2-23]|uniref:shikimate kinase n=1 Tax=Frigoribacterium sp. 2-23 TaxID=3415006 RepID=UPI003C6FBFED